MNPPTLPPQVSYGACKRDPGYFLRHTQIYDATLGTWLPFRLWPAQFPVLKTLTDNPLICILKARQLGLTWLVLGYALHLMTFYPSATVLIFSRREEESLYLLGEERLRGMHGRLPDWLKVEAGSTDAARTWMLANGSVARAFPTTAGDSYTATLVIVDEADLIPDLDRLMRAVKPTIDGGGQMILLSKSDKSRPMSLFKRIYTEGKAGKTPWKSIFLPWTARPDRDAAWYAEQCSHSLRTTGSLDDLHESYPASDVEAMSPRSLDKRIPYDWLAACYSEVPRLERPFGNPDLSPAIQQMEVYRLPEAGHSYVIGEDPAQGNPTSDDSSLEVLDRATGEEVCCLAGKYQPEVISAHADAIGKWYNNAAVMVERNNHGSACLLWFRDNSRLQVLNGPDGGKGWNTTTKSKTQLYDLAAESFRENETLVHSLATFNQLANIEGASLSAPEAMHDDRAIAYTLALAAIARHPGVIARPFILTRGVTLHSPYSR